MSSPTFDVVVVGGGPSGLAAATALRQQGAGRVAVLERERDAGGTPRHSAHTGFGVRDLHRVMSGPRYASTLVARARQWGVDLLCATTVTGWASGEPRTGDAIRAGGWTSGGTAAGDAISDSDDAGPAGHAPTSTGGQRLTIASADGPGEITASAVVLATGCRERPRAARAVAGDRPGRGVLTTGALQQLAMNAMTQAQVGRRAVVVGAEHVSFSAVMTLAHAGCRTVALVTEHRRHQTFATARVGAALRWRAPVHTSSRVTAIIGRHGTVEAVEITEIGTARVRRIECDTVVFSGDWIPDHELARIGRLTIDPGSRGPVTDQGGHTSREGVFAVGNLVHPAEAADVCSLAGRAVAPAVVAYLRGGSWPAAPVAIVCDAPLLWVAPGAITLGLGPPGRHRLIARVDQLVRSAQLVVEQDGRLLDRQRLGRLVPTRPVEIDAGWMAGVDAAAGPVTMRLR